MQFTQFAWRKYAIRVARKSTDHWNYLHVLSSLISIEYFQFVIKFQERLHFLYAVGKKNMVVGGMPMNIFHS